MITEVVKNTNPINHRPILSQVLKRTNDKRIILFNPSSRDLGSELQRPRALRDFLLSGYLFLKEKEPHFKFRRTPQ